ncbi:MAG: hypothetical protein NHB32_22315 [Fischerella sp. CENA71]|nr:hypothetical protein [Fischerella sp. CENA71]
MNMLPVIYPLCHIGYIIAQLILLNKSIQTWHKSNSIAMIVLPMLLLFSTYDNLVLLMGSFIGEGELLKSLNMLRFLSHYIVVPLFIVVVVELAHRAGANWAASQFIRIFGWILAIGLGIYDITTQFIDIQLVPETFAGMLRYVVAAPSKPPMITILVNLFVMIIGIGIWRRLQWYWLFVGALVSLVGNAIPTDMVGTVFASGSELIMAWCMLLTEQRTQYMFALWNLSNPRTEKSKFNLQLS